MTLLRYPWHASAWQRLQRSSERRHHALLLKGKQGIGKLAFASTLANAMLCQSPSADGYACGHCISCGWFVQNSHPDYRLLSPEQEDIPETPAASKKPVRKSTQISVTQIRELAGFLELSSHQSHGMRVVVIHPADALNQTSANALLKMLEEPPADVMFILVTSHPQSLLPTIMSRCQQLEMPVPSEQEALAWLEQQGIGEARYWLAYSGGSPLSAAEAAVNNAQVQLVPARLAQGRKLDPFSAAGEFASIGMEAAATAFQKWLYDLVAVTLNTAARYHLRDIAALQSLGKKVDLSALLAFQRQLDEVKRSASHPLNNELQLEHLLLQYSKLFSE
ncbi:DNA polymerase III subunit delta' [Methylobacillus flagellatus]|uniref:DNA polymerase III, delta prime subunit n=1 Tax=Methylobacillus flagellatus (strain ATCC 51484 / DSM 6875 / VKM B-1610 / KT) TaxID=265072 RepID=Q1H170_METFK|nr:DNA polymerase III subunit delta' [Methylobacillus flagellatus]ABE49767.1 DNA polymerase III, delta prime subunit [Methylobacillus flagellatus KT]